ncbi:hypothetical protein C9I86_13205 [Photobacterium sp. NCIMB 13483]|uniref:hypothetical protein n=1 Tax=Photobacterium sp. NCIMB 13483 TaxID=2022103 RepID=UPI000D17E5BE|nr:hypothetical protein [Photobacterium sp. NCIMB 13483]PST87341.1 hypothetical protein C9I86_13205 [Photobacterium sp. NCIMB 13483]
MEEFDFSVFDDEITNAIKSMKLTFSFHELILEIAKNNQSQYIKALFAYEKTERPFMYVHQQLSFLMKKHEGNVIKNIGKKPSKDIFGKSNTCVYWERII